MKRQFKKITAKLNSWIKPTNQNQPKDLIPLPPKKVHGNDLGSLSLPIPVFPATTPEELLELHIDQVIKIRNVLGLSVDETKELLDPVLLRYVELVHLLPASEIHHHRSIGGLLRHGFEVAFWSGQHALAYSFEYQGKLRDKRQHVLRWRFAFVLGGLLHDLGKTVSDMVVTDSTGYHVWHPFNEAVWEWSKRLDISGYYVFWRKNRVHKQHENNGFPLANRVMGPDVLTYLSQYDQDLLQILFSLLSGHPDKNSAIYKAVSDADSHSTKKDLEKNGVPINTYLQGSPLDLRLVEIMRELSKKTWTVNVPGSVIWHLPEGLFLHWEKAVEDINRMVSSMNFVGIPKDEGVLADTLIDSGIAKAHIATSIDTGEEKLYRYHPLLVKGKEEADKTELEKINKTHDDFHIYGLLITDFSYVFNGPCPPVLETPIVVAVKQASTAPISQKTKQEVLSQKSTGISKKPSKEKPPIPKEPIAEEVPVVQEVPLLLDELVNELVAHQGEPPPLEENPTLEVNNENQEQTQADNTTTDLKGLDEPPLPTAGGLLLPSSFERPKVASNVDEDKNVTSVMTTGLMLPTHTTIHELNEQSKKADKINKTQPTLTLPKSSTPKSSTKTKDKDQNETQIKVRVDKDLAIVETGDFIDNYLNRLTEKTTKTVFDLLIAITLPILKQESFLGPELIFIQRHVYICYPNGLKKLGDPDELVSLLAQDSAIETEPSGQNIHNVDGQLVLKLATPLSNLISKTLDEMASMVDPVVHDDDISFSQTLDKEQAPEPNLEKEVSEPCEPWSDLASEMPPDSFYENDIAALDEAWPFDFLLDNSEVYAPPPEPLKVTPEDDDIALNQEQILDEPEHDMSAQSDEPTESDDELVIDSSTVAAFDAALVISQLVEMIKAGEGRWIRGGVRRVGHELFTDDACLDAIVKSYPNETTKEQMQKHIFFNRRMPRLSARDGEIVLTHSDE